MSKFINKLEDSYQMELEWECPPESKLEYLGRYIFNFTTYDGHMDLYLAKRMLPVLDAILNRTTFEYIKRYYNNYLVMVNMPFLVDKLEWGTSIRGAWFDESKAYGIDGGNIEVNKGELCQFVRELIEWSNTSK